MKSQYTQCRHKMRSKSCFYGRSIHVGNTMENVKQINLLNYAERAQREREIEH